MYGNGQLGIISQTQDRVKDRQEESRSLARAGLGAAHQIPLGLHDGDGVLLDRCGLHVPTLGYVLLQERLAVKLSQLDCVLESVFEPNISLLDLNSTLD